MFRALVALTATAGVAAAIDLASKAGAVAPPLHQRSALYVAVVAGGSFAWAFAIVLTRSVPLSAAGGLVLGGAAGNVLSLAIWPGVPNPIVVEPIAFNLADAFVFVGFGLVCAAAAGIAVSDPDRLRAPVGTRSR
jgi:lipoprotein signal peptidase